MASSSHVPRHSSTRWSIRCPIGPPLLLSGPHHSEGTVLERTRRADRRGAETLPDLVERDGRRGPVRRLCDPIGRSQFVERQLAAGHAQIRPAHTEQTHAWAGIDRREQWPNSSQDVRGEVEDVGGRRGPADRGEVAEAHLELQRAGADARRPEPPRHAVDETDQLPIEFGGAELVGGECFLVADRFRGAIGLELPIVVPDGERREVACLRDAQRRDEEIVDRSPAVRGRGSPPVAAACRASRARRPRAATPGAGRGTPVHAPARRSRRPAPARSGRGGRSAWPRPRPAWRGTCCGRPRPSSRGRVRRGSRRGSIGRS